MRQKSPRKSWFLALSLALGIGLALIVTNLASAQKAQIGEASQKPNDRSEQGPRQADTPPASPTPTHRYYVSKGGNGFDGLSWSTAFTQVQDALAVAANGVEIWVAHGVYTPGVTISESFNLASGVEIYGGFAATETLREQRDWVANPTVLSGDIFGNDVSDPNGVVTDTGNIVGDNSYHVISADGAGGTPITSTTVLDGFSITGGKADGVYPNDSGAGFFCVGDGGGSECSPSLRHLIFSGNSASYYGGAIYNYGRNGGDSSPSLVDVTFFGSSASYYGGAIFNDGYEGVSNPSLVDVIFSGNSAGTNGGAMFNYGFHGTSSPSLSNATFSGNSAGSFGGAIYNYGSNGTSSPSLINVTFSANSANTGGAMYNFGSFSAVAIPSLVNVILWKDVATVGAEIFNYYASPVITSSLVHGGINGTRIYNSTGGSVTDGGGNLDGDPLFARDPDPGDGDWTTRADNDYGDLRLTAGSPAIDAGDNSAVTLPTDLDGNPRIANEIVDMGAYEFIFLKIFLPLVMR